MKLLSTLLVASLLASNVFVVQAQIPWGVAPLAPFTHTPNFNSLPWHSPLAMQMQANGNGWVYYETALGMRSYRFDVAVTADDGQSWQNKQLPITPGLGVTDRVVGTPNNDIYTITDLVTSARVEYSRANSTTWTTSFEVVGVLPTKIGFFDNSTGIFVATLSGSPDVRVYRTVDAGVSWTALPLTLPVVSTLIIRGTHIWLPTTTGQVWHSGDAGQTWATWNSDWSSFTKVCFHDALQGLAVGASGQLFRTTDGGQTWTVVATTGPVLPVISPIETVPGAYVAINRYDVFGPAGLSISTDAGTTWQSIDTSNKYVLMQMHDLSQGWTINGNTIQAKPRLDFMRLNGNVLVNKAAKLVLAPSYPNPTTGQLHVPGAAGCTARVFDTMGRLAFAGMVAGDAVLDLSECQPGLYQVQLIDKKGATSFQQIAVTR